uniref:WD40 repeat domain-containing protein n=1 Tax=candidate division WOR-3 bacterium TaxID=2052148 RepID=A0A7C4Y5S3_UNCW3
MKRKLFIFFLLFSGCVSQYYVGELQNEPVKLPEFYGANIDKTGYKCVIVDIVDGKIIDEVNTCYNPSLYKETLYNMKCESTSAFLPDEDGNLWVNVLSKEGNIVRIIDIGKGKILKEIGISSQPTGIYATDKYMIVWSQKDDKIMLFDKKTKTFIKEKSYGPVINIILDDEGEFLWGFFKQDTIWELCKIGKELDSITKYPVFGEYKIWMVKNGKIYIPFPRYILSIDTTGDIDTFEIPKGYLFVDGIRVGEYIWRALCDANERNITVQIVDDTFGIIKTIGRHQWENGDLWGMGYSPSLKRVFVADAIYDANTEEIIGELKNPIRWVNK